MRSTNFYNACLLVPLWRCLKGPMSDKPHPAHESPSSSHKDASRWLTRLVAWGFGLIVAGLLAILFVVGVAMVVAYPHLPDISDLSDYRPKLPLRIYTADGVLMGEFGEERRHLTPIAEIPKVMKDAVLSIEDARFYQHGGVDYLGILRAGIANIGRMKSQGASTITMQVARNVYLSSEKTYTRKIYEILLTYKLEHMLSKDQILEIYMNQIFLGNRAYGFASAAETYFGKSLQDITVAEAAMLAGLPKAPSAYNPFANPKRARARQLYIIERMEENGFITKEQAKAAKAEPLRLRTSADKTIVHAEYVAETVRQMVYAQYGPETYTRGLNVTTTLVADEQRAAYRALRQGIMDYERRQFYRGPEKFIDLPTDPKKLEEAIDDALDDHPDNGDLLSAWCSKQVRARLCSHAATVTRLRSRARASNPCNRGFQTRRHRRCICVGVPWSASCRCPKAATKSPSNPRWKALSSPSHPKPAPCVRWSAALTLPRTNSTTSPRPGASRAPASSPSSIRRRLKKVSPRPPWSMTHRFSSTLA